MSVENEGQHLSDQPTERDDIQSQKNVGISYTRDFLLSLGELDVCKKLPRGFDPSILSEFEDASQDRLRSSGSLPLHAFRRTEYGSSPPVRGETGSYSRSIAVRWDSRSSGRSDRDSDSQSDRDSDSGRCYSNQSRGSWQGPEHDGLLGSGSFQGPSGYGTGAAAPKFRANDHYQLNKSNEPYHPPRPYKAVPFSRRDNNDTFNDETFGSSELSSENRAEEEKKRRASFELMRKEQQKEFQEKQKLNPNKPKDEFDITTLLDNPKDDKGHMNRKNKPDELMKLAASNSDSEKPSFPSQTLASRPLVPPGFASSMSEKNIANKSLPHSHSLEVHNPNFDGSLQPAKNTRLSKGTSHNQEEKRSLKPIGLSEQKLEIKENIDLSSSADISNKKTSVDGQSFTTSYLSEAFEGSEGSSQIGIDAEEITRSTEVHNSNMNHSILDQLLGGALALNEGGSSGFAEHNDGKVDDNMSPGTVHSSRFAQWFFEEEKRRVDDLSSGRPSDFLSLIVGGEKVGSHGLDLKSTENITSNSKLPFHISEIASTHTTLTLKSPAVENSEHLYPINKPEAVQTVLTCEDLEQSILSEVTENGPTLPPPVQSSYVPRAQTLGQKSDIDDHASGHLLSLLQNRTGLKDTAPSPTLDAKSSEELQNIESAILGSALGNLREANSETVSNSRKPLILETLFGTAFMKELQSVGAPISIQMGSVGSARVDVSEDQGLIEVGSNITIHERGVLASNQRQKMESDKVEEHLLGLDPRNEFDTSQLRTEIRSELGGFDGSVDIRLPEEDSLITVSDPVHLQNFMPARSAAKTELLSAQETPIDIGEKLAALHSALRDERSIAGGHEGPPFRRGPYDVRESDIPYHNPHVHPSSSQLHTPQLNHVGPLFRPPEHPANNNSQMKFMGSDGVIRHDPLANYQFSANVLHPSIHHASSGRTGFDPTINHPMLQQMSVPGNLPPPHLRGFERGAPVPPHLNNQVAGFMQEHNPLPGFPFGNRQPNYGGIGMPTPGPPDVGGIKNPEVLQRLIGMELRANSKQVPPFAATAHNQGMYSHELDMGFGYR
ncbi:hypothetical protein HS088_TW18G00434 [Tripterygium wilfordii]|uniref:Chorismate synthase n=1 Tax=Tripterygium wilfordii TaxID=458696 RepID=A0A7J7CCA0_TRIWF|nr:uncharacterized protein LOC119984006 [Tripterygium wilfordii]KAF5731749.1 hypothetical protein HS088_TW18G00434 [Tripterygium wilfordii]